MPHNHAYVERGRSGRPRIVIPKPHKSHRRSRSRDNEDFTPSNGPNTTSASMEALEIQIGQLQTRLSFEQSNNWNMRRQNESLLAQLEAEKQEVIRIDDLLYGKELEHDELKEKYKQLKRSSSSRRHSRSRSGSSDFRRAFEEKAQEAEVLRVRLAERDEYIKLEEARIMEKNALLRDKSATIADMDRRLRDKTTTVTEQNEILRERSTTIAYLKNYLRTHGFRVED